MLEEDKQRLARRCLGGEACRAALLASSGSCRQARVGLTRRDGTDGKRQAKADLVSRYLSRQALPFLSAYL